MTVLDQFTRDTVSVGKHQIVIWRHDNIGVYKDPDDTAHREHWGIVFRNKDAWGRFGFGEGATFHSCEDACSAALAYRDLLLGVDVDKMKNLDERDEQSLNLRNSIIEIARAHKACRAMVEFAVIELENAKSGIRMSDYQIVQEVERRLGKSIRPYEPGFETSPEVRVVDLGGGSIPPAIVDIVNKLLGAHGQPGDLKTTKLRVPLSMKTVLFDIRLVAKDLGYIDIVDADNEQLLRGLLNAIRTGMKV